MKVRTMGRTIEIPDEKVKGGVVGHPVGRPNSTPQSMGPHEVQDVGTFPVKGSNPFPSPLPGWPKQQDKWNYAYAVHLEQAKQFKQIRYWWYEPFSLWLPGGVRYKPDFMVWSLDSDKMELIELKGWSRNLRDGMTRLKIASSLMPCFRWKLVKRVSGTWEEVRL